MKDERSHARQKIGPRSTEVVSLDVLHWTCICSHDSTPLFSLCGRGIVSTQDILLRGYFATGNSRSGVRDHLTRPISLSTIGYLFQNSFDRIFLCLPWTSASPGLQLVGLPRKSHVVDCPFPLLVRHLVRRVCQVICKRVRRFLLLAERTGILTEHFSPSEGVGSNGVVYKAALSVISLLH